MKNSTHFFMPLLSLLIILATSCAKKTDETPTEKIPGKKPTVVGRVASIPASKSFVLIQAYGTWSVANGSILTTQGPGGRAANLRVTGEKLGQYAAADIQSGTLEIGDGVYTVIAPPKKSLLRPSLSDTKEKEKPPETSAPPKNIPANQPALPILPAA